MSNDDTAAGGFVSTGESAPGEQPAGGRRVLFLDFDGCLHPLVADELSNEQREARHFQWVPALQEILQGHDDVALVVHSTWRYLYSVEECRELLGPLGPRVLATVPRGPRYESILWWLNLSPAYADYRILDGDPREFPVPPPAALILCDPLTGITSPEVVQALRDWLERPRAQA